MPLSLPSVFVDIYFCSILQFMFCGSAFGHKWKLKPSLFSTQGRNRTWPIERWDEIRNHFKTLEVFDVNYPVEPPLKATSPQRPLLFVPADSPYITSCLNLPTTATSLQRQRPLKWVPNCQNNLSTTASTALFCKNLFFISWCINRHLPSEHYVSVSILMIYVFWLCSIYKLQ